ncbi:MAG: helix-turn-helix transcriptional regulator [Chloroflexi bacterium]|nr:helix-turn-helix transcriptional regulator [Chloroflexota bacterium]
MADDTPDCLQCCLRLFEQLGDVAGVAACGRALAQGPPPRPTASRPAAQRLTRREVQVAQLVAHGLTNGQIAAVLGIA